MASRAAKAQLGLPKLVAQWHHQDVPFTAQMLESFADELEKIAKVHLETVEDMEKFLKPGDVLVTKPKKLDFGGKILRPFLKAFQGTEYTHAALYAGNGKIIDSGLWKGKAKVTKVPLKKYIDRYEFKVLRVNATPTQRQDAVEYAEEQIGKPFSLMKMVRLALPTGKAEGPRKRQELDKMFCSELIANAYPDHNFAAERKIQHVRPVDIHRSPLTKTVAEHTSD